MILSETNPLYEKVKHFQPEISFHFKAKDIDHYKEGKIQIVSKVLRDMALDGYEVWMTLPDGTQQTVEIVNKETSVLN